MRLQSDRQFFSQRSSTKHTPLQSCRLAELKFAIFRRTGHKNIKSRNSNLFPSTISQRDRHFHLNTATQAICRRKALDQVSYNMQFQQNTTQDWKIKPSKVQNLPLHNKRTWSLQYGLLEGLTFIFRYSYTSRTPFESSRLGEQSMQFQQDRTSDRKLTAFARVKFNEKLPLRKKHRQSLRCEQV